MDGIVELETCASTQDEARERLLDGHLDFLAVRALRQSRGRGRSDREWISPPGNLYLTLAFRVDPSLARPWPFVSLLAGWTAARSLERLGAWDEACFIKWPNDLYRLREGRLSKLGGILTELRRDVLLVGIGINITASPDLGASVGYLSASLGDIFAAPPTAARLAAEIVEELRNRVEEWIRNPAPQSHECANELSWRWMRPFFAMPGLVEGMGRVEAVSLLEDGRLLVRNLDGSGIERAVTSGEFVLGVPE